MNLAIKSGSPVVPACVADTGRISFGAGVRLPTAPTHVADQGRISFGAGIRLPTVRKPA
jgi:hypothetical protein